MDCVAGVGRKRLHATIGFVLQFLQTAGWLACVVYATIPAFWLMIHPRAAYWRLRRSPYVMLVPAWMTMWVLVGLVTFPWRNAALYSNTLSWFPAIVFVAIGFAIYIVSGRNFGGPLISGKVELASDEQEQRLVTTGIRSRIRHPLYLAHLCEMLGWSIGTGLLICYLLTVIAVITGAVMIKTEDAELEKRFGPDYTEYRKRVPALLPRMNGGPV